MSSNMHVVSDRQGSPSTSQRTSPAPKFAEKDMNEGQLKRSRQLNSEGLEVSLDFVCCCGLSVLP